jgi:stalled ribosome alternative rescue factor ArfA
MIKKGRGSYRRAFAETGFLFVLGLVVFLTIKRLWGI